MRTWLRHQRDAIRRTFRRFGQAPLVTLVSVIAIGVTLALPVGLYLALLNLQGVAGRINAEPEISIFLALDAASADVQAVEATLKANPAVARYQFIAREDALNDLRTATALGDVLEGLDKNPLPHAFVVRGTSSEPAALELLRDQLALIPKVEHVQLDSAWAKRLDSLNSAGEKIVILLAVVLGATLVAVTGNTIRLQILAQQDEIEVGRLIGATDSYVRRPYLYFGALQGLLGGLTALGLAVAALLWLAHNMEELIQVYAPEFRPEAIPLPIAGTIVAIAALLGWLGAYASVSLYLRQIRPR